MRIYVISSFIMLLYIFLSCSALPWTQGYLKYEKNNFMHLSPNKFWNRGLDREPNCDELRAMWRFSMLKSRRTEITNEIPTYLDPFANNLWEPHARSKHLENDPLQGSGSRSASSHVYGKVVHSAPPEKYADKSRMSGKSFDDMAKFFTVEKEITPRRKNAEAFRLPNGAVSFRKLPALSDSFRRLKAIVRAQKAKELHTQQSAEQPLPYGTVKNANTNAPLYSRPLYEFFYFGNSSFSGKRMPVSSKSLHFIANPSSFVYGPLNYYDYYYLPEHYVADYGYNHRTRSSPYKVKFRVFPVSMPSRY